MLIADIDLPEGLLDAQNDGSLVIFAGAGTSMGAPSKLPDFGGLAKEVVEDTLVRDKDEPFDRFLGRADKQGVLVHQRSQKILNRPSSLPNSLHHDIFSLFRSSENIRIVTTNFDRHFSTVLESLSETQVETFYAPALPLGRFFSGLVYLHGSVDKTPDSLILTDQDFGRAYLTDGWATRFLQNMFAHYTVLFIGYSHNDPVMSYLSRGLPQTDCMRYALTTPNQDNHWEFLDIVPIEYPKVDETNPHRKLSDIVNSWADNTTMSVLDHEQRIKAIVEAPFSTVDPELSYLEHMVNEVTNVRFFISYARAPEWLRWVENQPGFQKLLQPHSHAEQEESIRRLAGWYAEFFVFQYPDEALALLARHHFQMHDYLYHQIITQLYSNESSPNSATIARWVSVLLPYKPTNLTFDTFGHLLSKLRYPDDMRTALILFEHLTKPCLVSKSYSLSRNEEGVYIEAELRMEGDDHFLQKAWTGLFQPNLDVFALQIEPILTRHFSFATLLLCSFEDSENPFDAISYNRLSIEPHDQNKLPSSFDALIGAARDIIEWLVQNEPEQARLIIDKWSISNAPLLRRLAIHGMKEHLGVGSDKKIDWVLEMDWIYQSYIKHEVFRLLKMNYPSARQSIRKRLIKRIMKGPDESSETPEEKEQNIYEVYNILIWLNEADPGCQLIGKALLNIQKTYPDLEKRDHPDLSHWISDVWRGSESPLTVEQILEKDPDRDIHWFLTYEGVRTFGSSRRGLLNILSDAVGESWEWGWKLGKALEVRLEWETDLWGYIISGWLKSSFTDDQWQQVLEYLLSHSRKMTSHHESISDLLSRGVTKEQHKIPEACFDIAERLADYIYDACEVELHPPEKISDKDWIFKSINHTGGKLAQFWLQTLSERLTASEDNRADNFSAFGYHRYFQKIVEGSSYTAQLGRVVLVGQIFFLFTVDRVWTRQYVIPLLDWSIDERRAAQAWDGYLFGGRWNNTILPDLLPFYEQSFGHLSSEEMFCRHIAEIAVFGSIHPLEQGWLLRFIKKASIEGRKRWSELIAHQLGALEQETVRGIWRRWIDEYWSKRLDGIPVPLNEEEIEEMVEWIIPLEPVFSEVVNKIRMTPLFNLSSGLLLYYRLSEDKFPDKYTTHLPRLIEYLLKSVQDPFLHCNEVENITNRLIELNGPREEIISICEELARLGCPNAVHLRQQLGN